MDRKFYRTIRVLFVLNNCPICRVWLEFIGIINHNLPLEKQIIVREVSRYYDWGLIEDPLISAFKKYLTHSYPILFFDGMQLQVTSSREEVEAFIRTLTIEEIKIKEYLRYLIKPNCEYKKIPILGKRLTCTNI